MNYPHVYSTPATAFSEAFLIQKLIQIPYAYVILLEFRYGEAAMTAETSFGQWLRQRRKALDLTREQLAQRVSCAVVTITKLEAGERRPSRQIAELLAEHLNIPTDQRPAFVSFARGEATDSATPWGTPFHPLTNLSPQLTALIGREADVTAIRKRLLQSESRLLTLVGPPGVGKTRLALQVAADVLDAFVDGVFVVALAPISDATLLPATIASTLGVQESGQQTPLERLKLYLRDRHMLLVLDNFEQILPAAPLLAELLTVCPSLKILVTSRAPLRIRPERQFPVSPLALPDLEHLPDVQTVSGYASITLFLERAQAVKPDFALTQESAPTVAALCTRLDGLPLAIELISARIKLLPPLALLERLYGRLMLQSDGLRDIEPRHRTLNNAIEWSYHLLNAEEQTLFRRLGVFVGGWTLDTAEAVCLDTLRVNILDGLASLLDKNLIKQEAMSEGEPRFGMLETIREYALERLASNGELESLQQRHADYFLSLIAPPIRAIQPKYKDRWDELEVEHPNLRAALTWSLKAEDQETGLRLALGLFQFWRARGHMSEGRHWFTRLLALPEKRIPPAQPNRIRRGWALECLGLLCIFQSDLDAAEPAFGQSLALFRELEDSVGIAELLGDHGYLFEGRGDYERANAYYQESLLLLREIGKPDSISVALFLLGVLTHARGELRQARAYLEESLAILGEVKDSYVRSSVLSALARIELEQGNYAQSRINLVESVTNLWNMDERWRILPALELFAFLMEAERQELPDGYDGLLQSARLFGAVEALHESLSIGTTLFEQQFIERGIANLRAQLDETTMAVAWAEGRAMTLEQAIAFALELTSKSVGTTLFEQGNSEVKAGNREREHDKLTERELEVLRLVAAGHSNRQIANDLFLTLNTAKSHIHHIYGKLGVASRTQAVSRANELHLL